MQGNATTTRQARRQLGARLPRALYDQLKIAARAADKSYPAILADAFIAHGAEVIAREPSSNGDHPFQYRPPTRVVDGVLVQFYLNTTQIALLKDLANTIGESIAGAIRTLLERHLEPASQNGATL